MTQSPKIAGTVAGRKSQVIEMIQVVRIRWPGSAQLGSSATATRPV